MHFYHDAHEGLPPHAGYSKEGKPLLSWRVLLLPWIEQKELYEQFNLDEPWDSPHNLPLLARMPEVYKPVEGGPPALENATYFQVFVGKGTAFEGEKGLNIKTDFPDGTSNTLLIAQAAHAVPWTKPEDLTYSPLEPLPKLSGIRPRSFQAAFADG